jgi:hypothetical protein
VLVHFALDVRGHGGSAFCRVYQMSYNGSEGWTHHLEWRTWGDDRTDGPWPTVFQDEFSTNTKRRCTTHPLLLPPTQHIPPFLHCIPTSLPIYQIPETSRIKQTPELVQRIDGRCELRYGLRIDNLREERSGGVIRALWDDEYPWAPVCAFGGTCQC